MYEVKKILFPVELAEISARIALHVTYRAEKYGAQVHVLHVLPDPVQFASVFYVEPQMLRTQEALVKEASEHLEKFTNENGLKSATKAIMIGDTVEAILEYVTKHRIDQIIMGTHGRKGLERIHHRFSGPAPGPALAGSRPDGQPLPDGRNRKDSRGLRKGRPDSGRPFPFSGRKNLSPALFRSGNDPILFIQSDEFQQGAYLFPHHLLGLVGVPAADGVEDVVVLAGGEGVVAGHGVPVVHQLPH